MSRKLLILLLSVFVAGMISAQTIARFEVKLPVSAEGLNVPVSINLDGFTFIADSAISLFEVKGKNKIPVPFQVTQGEQRTIEWMVLPGNNQQRKYTYELVNAKPALFNEITADKDEEALTFHAGNKNLLRYFFKTVYPPDGIDSNFKRSGFIHPLWTPHGQELTRIQAPDHYHHYGIWNPWTHVLFEKDTVDFWNIKGHQGTVRFAKFISVTNGPIYAQFEALHEHVVFEKDGTEKVALNELQTVRVYQPEASSDYFIVDFTSKLNCATQSPFLIMAYRYAGFGWRTTGYWDNNNCEVLTSEGKTRKDTDGSKAKWCMVQGALPGNDSGGVVMMSYPANYNHPEPLRIWVLNTNGRGDMFANFAPTKDRDWLLEPGKTYVLRYRLLVFNGKFDAAKANAAWKYFAVQPEIRVLNK